MPWPIPLRAIVTHLAVFALLLASGCHVNRDVDLLNVDVGNSRTMDVMKLNRQLDAVQVGDQPEALDVVRAVSTLWSHLPARQSLISTVRNDGTRSEYDVLVILDDASDDDSVSAYRYELKVSHQGNVWQIVSGRESWRCWPDRGHRGFSTEPCA